MSGPLESTASNEEVDDHSTEVNESKEGESLHIMYAWQYKSILHSK